MLPALAAAPSQLLPLPEATPDALALVCEAGRGGLPYGSGSAAEVVGRTGPLYPPVAECLMRSAKDGTGTTGSDSAATAAAAAAGHPNAAVAAALQPLQAAMYAWLCTDLDNGISAGDRWLWRIAYAACTGGAASPAGSTLPAAAGTGTVTAGWALQDQQQQQLVPGPARDALLLISRDGGVGHQLLDSGDSLMRLRGRFDGSSASTRAAAPEAAALPAGHMEDVLLPRHLLVSLLAFARAARRWCAATPAAAASASAAAAAIAAAAEALATAAATAAGSAGAIGVPAAGELGAAAMSSCVRVDTSALSRVCTEALHAQASDGCGHVLDHSDDSSSSSSRVPLLPPPQLLASLAAPASSSPSAGAGGAAVSAVSAAATAAAAVASPDEGPSRLVSLLLMWGIVAGFDMLSRTVAAYSTPERPLAEDIGAALQASPLDARAALASTIILCGGLHHAGAGRGSGIGGGMTLPAALMEALQSLVSGETAVKAPGGAAGAGDAAAAGPASSTGPLCRFPGLRPVLRHAALGNLHAPSNAAFAGASAVAAAAATSNVPVPQPLVAARGFTSALSGSGSAASGGMVAQLHPGSSAGAAGKSLRRGRIGVGAGAGLGAGVGAAGAGGAAGVLSPAAQQPVYIYVDALSAVSLPLAVPPSSGAAGAGAGAGAASAAGVGGGAAGVGVGSEDSTPLSGAAAIAVQAARLLDEAAINQLPAVLPAAAAVCTTDEPSVVQQQQQRLHYDGAASATSTSSAGQAKHATAAPAVAPSAAPGAQAGSIAERLARMQARLAKK